MGNPIGGGAGRGGGGGGGKKTRGKPLYMQDEINPLADLMDVVNALPERTLEEDMARQKLAEVQYQRLKAQEAQLTPAEKAKLEQGLERGLETAIKIAEDASKQLEAMAIRDEQRAIARKARQAAIKLRKAQAAAKE